jgi:hypothetical protein
VAEFAIFGQIKARQVHHVCAIGALPPAFRPPPGYLRDKGKL